MVTVSTVENDWNQKARRGDDLSQKAPAPTQWRLLTAAPRADLSCPPTVDTETPLLCAARFNLSSKRHL